MKLRSLNIGLCAMAILLSAATVYGQFGGGGGGGGDRRRGGYDPAEMLKGMDGDRNGLIEPSEVSQGSRMVVDRAAERAGLDEAKAMPIVKRVPGMLAGC